VSTRKLKRLRIQENRINHVRGVTLTRVNWGGPSDADYYYTVDLHLGEFTVCMRTSWLSGDGRWERVGVSDHWDCRAEFSNTGGGADKEGEVSCGPPPI
jgi:hypothetical protein